MIIRYRAKVDDLVDVESVRTMTVTTYSLVVRGEPEGRPVIPETRSFVIDTRFAEGLSVGDDVIVRLKGADRKLNGVVYQGHNILYSR